MPILASVVKEMSLFSASFRTTHAYILGFCTLALSDIISSAEWAQCMMATDWFKITFKLLTSQNDSLWESNKEGYIIFYPMEANHCSWVDCAILLWRDKRDNSLMMVWLGRKIRSLMQGFALPYLAVGMVQVDSNFSEIGEHFWRMPRISLSYLQIAPGEYDILSTCESIHCSHDIYIE